MMGKFTRIAAEDLHYLGASGMHPANTYFHFSFADYYDPDNTNFGVLRVVNDDEVKPRGGFATHPHRDMEIFSYVVGGKLTHRDSAGNHEELGRGHVQCISAGTGVTHSELNEQDDWCRFLQIWILPETGDLPVKYDFNKFSFEDRHNKLLHIVSGSKSKNRAPLRLNQDINVYVSELDVKDARVSFTVNEGRQAYIFCFEGSLDIANYPSLHERDSLKISGQAAMEFALASDAAHFIILEMEQE